MREKKARERQQIHKSEGIMSVKNLIFKYICSQTLSRSSHQAPPYFFFLSLSVYRGRCRSRLQLGLLEDGTVV